MINHLPNPFLTYPARPKVVAPSRPAKPAKPIKAKRKPKRAKP